MSSKKAKNILEQLKHIKTQYSKSEVKKAGPLNKLKLSNSKIPMTHNIVENTTINQSRESISAIDCIQMLTKE